MEDLIKYRIKRANETLVEAKLLFTNGHYNTTISRLYYSCFYIVIALLLKNEIKAKSHSGVKTLFFQNFIKTNLLPIEFSDLYSNLFNSRNETDYGDFYYTEKEEIDDIFPKVEIFIIEIEKLINK